jgi:ABC-type transport system involved in multi-copper enzyme maturation permease subunit
MLWYKSWLDTRWRFLIGLGLLMIVACGTLFDYVATRQLMPLAGSINATGEIGRRIKEAVELGREYRGFVWLQWFRQNLSQMGTLFAVLLGSGGLLSRASGGGALYMLSLPASRNRLAGVRAATGLAEFLVLVVVPSLLIPLFSPAIGQRYSIVDALVHSGCLFVAGAVFFSLAFLLSTVFGDPWRPLLLACFVALALAASEATIQGFSRFGIFHVMSGEVYFRSGQLPWLGLLASTALSAALLYGATRNLARQDF